MKLVIGILIGLALAAGGFLLYTQLSKEGGKEELSRQITNAADEARQKLNEQMQALDLSTENIREELARSGRVVRRKAVEAGAAVSSATSDARITGAIKAKLLTSKELSAWDISVDTKGGVVTLSGTVGSQENIARAMAMALDTDDVQEVVSTLQVKGSAAPPAPSSLKPKTNSPPAR